MMLIEPLEVICVAIFMGFRVCKTHRCEAALSSEPGQALGSSRQVSAEGASLCDILSACRHVLFHRSKP